MKTDEVKQVVTVILNHCEMTESQALFFNNGRRSNGKVSRARHLIKYFLYFHCKLSTPQISREMEDISTGFDHASTLYSIGIVRAQKKYFFNDLIAIKELLTPVEEPVAELVA